MDLRKRIKLSLRGHRLLKLKRDSLILEFFQILDRAKKFRSTMVEDYRLAQERMAVARAVEGTVRVESAAFAQQETPTLTLKTKNVMGVVVPKIEAKAVKKHVGERGYGIIDTSPRIDEAASAYEQVVEDVIVAAEIETTMRRLLAEIERTKRRVNALEFRVIPELRSTEKFIRLRLEEIERDNSFRLKRFKEA